MKNLRGFHEFFVAVSCAPAVIFTILFLCILPADRAVVARRDFIVYWATGRQLARHGNPYDSAALQQIEKDAGFQGGASYYMRNTPWTLPLAMPLSFAGPTATALPWSLAMLGFLALAVRILWKACGHGVSYLAWLGYCFPPALFCVILGQTSILPLLGLAWFLSLHKTRPFAAGAALWLCTIKPHLILCFVVVLLVWIVTARRFRILAGACTAFAAGVLLTTWIDPAAWRQYAYYMHTSVITREFTPCFGDWLRDSIRPTAEWLAFVPAALACIWALAYFWPRRHRWDWLKDGGLLLLVSLLTAPFGWIFDQALALPAILFAISRNLPRAAIPLLACIYLSIEVQLISPFDMHSRFYLWQAPVWLAWYLYARASDRKHQTVQAACEV